MIYSQVPRSYTGSMTYDIGHHIDLSYLNKPHQVEKKTITQETSDSLLDVGTQFINVARFIKAQAAVKMERRIQVATA